MEDDLDLYGDLGDMPKAPTVQEAEQDREKDQGEATITKETAPEAAEAVAPIGGHADDDLIIELDDEEDDEEDDELRRPEEGTTMKKEGDDQARTAGPIRVQINAPVPTMPPPAQVDASAVANSDEEDDLDILVDEPGQGPHESGIASSAVGQPQVFGASVGQAAAGGVPGQGISLMQPTLHPTNRGAKPVPLGAHIPAAQGSWRPPPLYQAPKPAHRDDGLPLVFPSEALQLEARGDSAYHIKLPGQTRVAPDEYKEFLFLGHGAIFDIDIEKIDEKPWLNPGVNYAEYFNYDLTPYTWKDYADRVKQYKTELSMKGRIKTFESKATSGAERDITDLPPELAAAIAAEHKHPSRRPHGGGDHDSRARREERGHAPPHALRARDRQHARRDGIGTDAIVLGGERDQQPTHQHAEQDARPLPVEVPFAAMVRGGSGEPPPPWAAAPEKPWESQSAHPPKPWERQERVHRGEVRRHADHHDSRGGARQDWQHEEMDRYHKRGRFEGPPSERGRGYEGRPQDFPQTHWDDPRRDDRRNGQPPYESSRDGRQGFSEHGRRGSREEDRYRRGDPGRRREDFERHNRDRDRRRR